jgi:3-dehydroquinate synthase
MDSPEIAVSLYQGLSNPYAVPMRKVKVPLGRRTYLIHAGEALLASLGYHCRRLQLGDRCAILTDRNVAPLYADAAMDSLGAAGFDPLLVTVPAGESAKDLKVVAQCYNELAAHRLERRSFVVALGGGVVGDLAGFVAATFLRGIDFVQVPTTLLAQVDSSVGGKVGVNLRAGKNLVGAFHQPRLVLCDLDTLRTLPDREYRAGLAEVIKYGVIRDAALFRLLEKQMTRLLDREATLLSQVIARCCRIKAEVVGADETEQGLRAILNFGHTIGHALEAVAGYGRFLHGEAISIGQVLAARLSSEVVGLSTDEADRIRRLFEAAGLPVQVRLRPNARRELIAAMLHDKKVSGGAVKFVLVPRLGEARHGIRLAMDRVEQAVAEAGKATTWRQ